VLSLPSRDQVIVILDTSIPLSNDIAFHLDQAARHQKTRKFWSLEFILRETLYESNDLAKDARHSAAEEGALYALGLINAGCGSGQPVEDYLLARP